MSVEYNGYLKEHIANVRRGLEWISEHIDRLDRTAILDAMNNAYVHDSTKYSAEEYEAYDKYFYGLKNRSYKVVQDFNFAWLHHQHNNPHHWQYWVLVNDDPKDGTVALEMPLEYVYEMIADWWTFSWKSGDLTEIFDWYEKHKERMILHARTRTVVEDILNQMKKILVPEKDDVESNEEADDEVKEEPTETTETVDTLGETK